MNQKSNHQENLLFHKVRTSRLKRLFNWQIIVTGLVIVVLSVCLLTLMLGQTFTPLSVVLRVMAGEQIPGVSFTVEHLRLPRAVTSLLAGLSFGMAGVAFQTMLRNPLASPDIVGVSSGASAAAIFAIIILQLDGPIVSAFSIAMGLLVAIIIYMLAHKNGVAGTRLILIGIGVSAMIESLIAYTLSQASAWDLQESMRWLTGSINAAQISQTLPMLASLIFFGGLLCSNAKDLEALRMGEDTAAAIGIKVGKTRIIVIVCSVGLIAVATAVTGPIAFVAFLSGPIAARIVGTRGSLLIPAALVGAGLVLIGDYIGQFLLPTRYPVGVITGALGAPYLIYLIIRVNRKGGGL